MPACSSSARMASIATFRCADPISLAVALVRLRPKPARRCCQDSKQSGHGAADPAVTHLGGRSGAERARMCRNGCFSGRSLELTDPRCALKRLPARQQESARTPWDPGAYGTGEAERARATDLNPAEPPGAFGNNNLGFCVRRSNHSDSRPLAPVWAPGGRPNPRWGASARQQSPLASQARREWSTALAKTYDAAWAGGDGRGRVRGWCPAGISGSMVASCRADWTEAKVSNTLDKTPRSEYTGHHGC